MNKIDEFLKKGLYENKNTIMSYRTHLNRYFEIISSNPDTYFDNGRNYEDDLIQFWEYLKNKPPMTKRAFMNTVKRFLIRYDKSLRDLDIWDTIKARLKGTEAITEEYIPDNQELKQILLHTDIRTKAVALISITGGMRISEIVGLLPGDVRLDETPARITVRAEISKNNKKRTSFITPETVAVIKEWYKVRDKYLETAIKKCICNANKDPNDKRVFPYAPNTIRYSWDIAVKKAGFEDFDIKTKRRKLHFHCLRKFFRSYFGNADFSEHIMGHSGYLSTYRKYTDKQLAEIYLKYMDNLLIFETTPDLTDINKELQQLRRDNEEMKVQILELRLEKVEKKNGIN